MLGMHLDQYVCKRLFEWLLYTNCDYLGSVQGTSSSMTQVPATAHSKACKAVCGAALGQGVTVCAGKHHWQKHGSTQGGIVGDCIHLFSASCCLPCLTQARLLAPLCCVLQASNEQDVAETAELTAAKEALASVQGLFA